MYKWAQSKYLQDIQDKSREMWLKITTKKKMNVIDDNYWHPVNIFGVFENVFSSSWISIEFFFIYHDFTDESDDGSKLIVYAVVTWIVD